MHVNVPQILSLRGLGLYKPTNKLKLYINFELIFICFSLHSSLFRKLIPVLNLNSGFYIKRRQEVSFVQVKTAIV